PPRRPFGAGARGLHRPLRAPVALLTRLRERTRADDLLLCPVRVALLPTTGRTLDAHIAGGLPRRPRRARALLLGDRVLGVPQSRVALEPEGDQRQPVRVLLPSQLRVLGSE